MIPDRIVKRCVVDLCFPRFLTLLLGDGMLRIGTDSWKLGRFMVVDLFDIAGFRR